jgi:hypothetical protein
MADDLPYYETLFGIYTDDWTWSYGGLFYAVKYILTKEYLNEGCYTVDYTSLVTGTNTILFLYPHWIKKQCYIEGVIEGQLTLACDTDDATLTSYTVRLMKIDDVGVTEEIGTTGVITPTNVTLVWDVGTTTGEEIVYPFYITVSPEKKLLDKERIYVEVTIVAADNNLILYHSNDSTWEDFRIAIPFRGL